MAGGGGGGSTLEETPAFAAATVCLVLVLFSVFVEYIIHLIAHWLKSSNKIKLYEALEKIKSEFMILGFMSLLLTVSPESVTKICINANVAESWSPCKRRKPDRHERDLLSLSNYSYRHEIIRRSLAGDFDEDDRSPDPHCKEGKVQFISEQALHELHIFIFVLACVHVLNCVLTMALGKAKMNKWKEWEKEATTREYLSSHDPNRLRYIKDTSFGRRHMMGQWTQNSILLRILCFFRQFYSSVPKVDFLTLRHGFIMEHLAPQHQANFNFHNYIDRSLEEDFKVVVGIRPTIWFAAVVSLLFNKHDLHHSLWIPAIPVLILLVVGTKLQVIISKMANRIHATNEMVAGTPLVHLGDDLFWFNSPSLLLFLINFVLFQNAFQVTFYAYTWVMFGFKSCFHRENADKVIIICMGLLVLILCSYVILPLYALVTQMGSSMRPTIFSEKVANALKSWHLMAKKQKKDQQSTSCFHLLGNQMEEDEEGENMEAVDHVSELMPSSSNRSNGEIGMVELSIESPVSEQNGSRDFYFVRRTQSSVEFRR